MSIHPLKLAQTDRFPISRQNQHEANNTLFSGSNHQFINSFRLRDNKTYQATIIRHSIRFSGQNFRQYASRGSGSSSSTSSTIQPASHQTGANADIVGETASSDVYSPDIGPSITVVKVAAPVAVQTEEPNAIPEQIEQAVAVAPVPINLPTALAMIGGQHPVVGFARWRVQEAYAQLDRAKIMWLPSIQSGFNTEDATATTKTCKAQSSM